MKDKTFSELHEERKDDPKFQKIGVTELYELKSINAAMAKPAIQPWLWAGYIPLETCTLFAGKGGIGKSQVLAWIASSISTGKSFTINSTENKIDQGSVIILSAEDHLNYTIIPRLIAVGANMKNIEIIESAVDVKSKQKERFICLDQDIILLDKKIKEIGNVKLIIIDPVTAYLGNIKENKAVDVRTFILKLNKLAEQNNLSIILNTHTRKSSGGDAPSSASDEIMGSIAWANTVRMAFSITRHHEDDDLYVLIVSKTNHKKPDSMGYRIKPYEIKIDNEKTETSRIEWYEGKIDMNADEAVNKKIYEDRCEIDIGKEFILRMLSFGSKTKEEMYKAAEDEDINLHTLKLARQKLMREKINIVMERSSTDKRKFIWFIGK
jgi:RecA-family ATPase